MALSAMLSTVLLAIPQLSADELQLLRSRVGASASLTQSASQPDAGTGDYLMEGLNQELRRRGALASGKRLPARVIPSNYAEASGNVRTHFERHLGALSSADKSALGQLMGEALARYLEKGGVPISPSTLLNNVAKVPMAVDAAFPEYLENGVLPSCWRKSGQARG